MPDNFSSSRILKNSIFLYLRMLFTMWFNLWATRLVLANLGVEDMGIYGVVGSIVGLFSVLTGGVTTAVQRFISFELGKKDGQTNEVFCTSLNIIFILSALLVIVLETAGLWFLNTSVNIPETSLPAAFWVFQLSIVTCIVEMVSIPYNALIIAHERMDAFAGISILQVLLNWGAAFCLSLFLQNERLLYYAILLTLASLIIRLIYQFYCVVKFPEAKYHYGINRQMIREIGKFTSISTSSNILQTISGQGIVFVINWLFGVEINAVYQIALQLKNSVLSFGMNIFKAISPQITKTYADGEMENHKKLVYSGSKIEVYMILLLMVPFLFRADYIMKLWLGTVPEYATAFTICTIFISLTYAAFEPIRTAVMATNKIFKFMIYPEIFYLVTVLGLSYLVGKLTGNPIWMIATVVGLDIMTCVFRTYYAIKVTFLTFGDLLKKVFLPVMMIFASSSLGCFILSEITPINFHGLAALLIANTITTIILIYFLGCNKEEKQATTQIIKRLTCTTK